MIAEDGEILARGGNVFSGYLNRPEETAATLVDGWLHTGDLGELTDEGYLKVIGRKKELIITAGGKNLSPNNIEEAIKTKSPVIGQMLVYGDDKPFVTALVVLDPEGFPVWAAAARHRRLRPGRGRRATRPCRPRSRAPSRPATPSWPGSSGSRSGPCSPTSGPPTAASSRRR